MSSALPFEPVPSDRATRLITVVVDEAMIPLDRVLGAVRRRNMPIVALSVGPGPAEGTARVFAELAAEEGDVDRLVRQLRKLVGVHQAAVRPASAGEVRQLALIRLTPPGPRRSALNQVIAAHGVTVREERLRSLELEFSGSQAELEGGLRALAPFGILDVARSSPIVLDEDGAQAPATISSTRQDDRS